MAEINPANGKNGKDTMIVEPSTEQASPAAVPSSQLEELQDLLQRTQANFENYRKQTERRMEELKQFAAKDLIKQLLPILDNLELALKSAPAGEFAQGIELIYSQLVEVLEEQGVKAISTPPQVFDPYYHEPLVKVESDLPENTILEEFQKGFTIHGTVLRHAKVKVSSGKKGEGRIENENTTKNKNNHQEE